MKCPVCGLEWESSCEQTICIEKFNECIACRFGGTQYPHGSKSGTKEELDAISDEYKRIVMNELLSGISCGDDPEGNAF